MKYAYVIISAVFVCVLPATVPAYDGPAGVTFRAPFIEQGKDIETVALEGIQIQTKVRPDDKWSPAIDGKNRAFPDKFEATIADSSMMFRLRNQGSQKVKTNLLVPFDASDKSGTGFTEPLSIHAFADGAPVDLYRGPEVARGMMKIRSFRIPVEISPGTAITLLVSASHPLAVNPAWFQFVCADARLNFKNYKSLTASGCSLEFDLDPADERLKKRLLEFQWKTLFLEKPVKEQRHGALIFQGESIEWVRVFR